MVYKVDSPTHEYIGADLFKTEAMPEGSFEKMRRKTAEQEEKLARIERAKQEKLRKKEEKARMKESKKASKKASRQNSRQHSILSRMSWSNLMSAISSRNSRKNSIARTNAGDGVGGRRKSVFGRVFSKQSSVFCSTS